MLERGYKSISTIIAGPAVNFFVNDDCQANSVPFTNMTTGSVTGYSWNFGDGSTTSVINPSHSYTSPDLYQVSLTASNAAGCQNVLVKPVKIYSKPIPDFSVGPPPFSCSKSATPFLNNTSPLTDSNVSTWAWHFGDTNNGISGNEIHRTFIYQPVTIPSY